MIVDLSVPINQETPVYPGDPATSIKEAGVLSKDGYSDHYVSIGTHVGTHIDAPMHMLDGGKSLDQIPLEQFVGKGRLIKVTDPKFETVKKVQLGEGDIVLFQTGMSEKYHKSIYFEDYPVMSEEVAKYLVEAKVKMVGVDACSVDNQADFPIHKILLADNVLIIENLTNLDQLNGKTFKIYALPIKLEIDGSPARVVAEFE